MRACRAGCRFFRSSANRKKKRDAINTTHPARPPLACCGVSSRSESMRGPRIGIALLCVLVCARVSSQCVWGRPARPFLREGMGEPAKSERGERARAFLTLSSSERTHAHNTQRAGSNTPQRAATLAQPMSDSDFSLEAGGGGAKVSACGARERGGRDGGARAAHAALSTLLPRLGKRDGLETALPPRQARLGSLSA